MVFADETMSEKTTGAFHTAYEALKAKIDPAPQETVINPKYGSKRQTMVHSSFLFMSNHGDAVAFPMEDRRIYVIKNALLPANPSFYTKFYPWWVEDKDSKGDPVWGRHLWNYLKNRKVDLERLLSPPPMTTAKIEMVQTTDSPIDTAVRILCEIWPSPYVDIKAMLRCVNAYDLRLNLANLTNPDAVIRRVIRAKTENYPQTYIIRHNGKVVRPRVIANRIDIASYDVNPTLAPTRMTAEALDIFKDGLRIAGDLNAIKEQLGEGLEKEDL